ncbi:GntR family transcriptional regulator [Pseudooceanicola sp. 200-1SW]|uniref:GntR family transcriptional regulator n=1 Tax=Pseudooceanicola sp. 200-1SW TaxID=3425949 RepID=UPI003D7FDFBE
MAEDGAARDLSSEGIAAALRARMLAGDYALGQRLIEMDLAEEFGVGRGRVREAFRMLTGEGYLEFVANRGVLVRRYSRAELIEMGRVREVMEGLAARLAAERALDAAERADLEGAQARMDAAEAAGDLAGFGAENRAYHALIERLAGNGPAARVIDRVRIPLVRVQMPPADVEESIGRSNRDHRVITAAILSGAPEAAEAAMRAHVRAGNAHIARLPDRVFSD